MTSDQMYLCFDVYIQQSKNVPLRFGAFGESPPNGWAKGALLSTSQSIPFPGRRPERWHQVHVEQKFQNESAKTRPL